MDDQVASVLERAFPDRTVAEVGSTGPSWNDKNRTVGIEFSDGRAIYLKTTLEGDGSRIARARAVIDYVGANYEVAMPTVLASDADGQTPYLANESPEELAAWMREEMNRRLARI